jgi:hypothetical protein
MIFQRAREPATASTNQRACSLPSMCSSSPRLALLGDRNDRQSSTMTSSSGP